MRRFAILLPLLLAGCLTKNDLPLVSAYDRSSDGGKFIDKYDFAANTYAPDAEAAEKERRTIKAQSQGMAPLPGLQVYAQSVVDRLVQQSGVTTLSFKVYIAANMSPQAAAYPDGVILIHHRVFECAQNEDQLAFVLGHEISHVLLKHSASDFFEKIRPYLVTAVDVAASQMKDNGDIGKVVKLYGSDLLARDVLMPIWDRGKEAEADRMGLDLMAKAGYNPKEALSWLEEQKRFEDAFESEHQVERNALEKAIFKEGEKGQDNPALPQFNVMSLLSTALVEVQKATAQRHPDMQSRMDALLGYIDREYAEEQFRPVKADAYTAQRKKYAEIFARYVTANDLRNRLSSGEALSAGEMRSMEKQVLTLVSGVTRDHPYTRSVAASLRARQGKPALALENLDRAGSEDGMLPLRMEIQRTELLWQLGRRDDSYARLREVSVYYDWPLAVFPDMLRAAQQLGRSNDLVELRLTCVGRYPQSRQQCG